MNHKTIIAVLIAVIVVELCIILWPSEQVHDTSGENEIYRERINSLLSENDSLKSQSYRLSSTIDSLNEQQKKPSENNLHRHKRIDSIPNDSLSVVLHRMLDSLGAVINAR